MTTTPPHNLPTIINVTRVMSFDVAEIVRELREARLSSEWVNSAGERGGQPASTEITLEDVLEEIDAQATAQLIEDAQETRLRGYIFTDQDGNELD